MLRSTYFRVPTSLTKSISLGFFSGLALHVNLATGSALPSFCRTVAFPSANVQKCPGGYLPRTGSLSADTTIQVPLNTSRVSRGAGAATPAAIRLHATAQEYMAHPMG